MKIKLLALLLICSTVLAGSPAIWGPSSTSRLLQQNLNLNNLASMLTGTADPSSVAQNAPQGSLYLRTGASGGTLWVKQDAGSSTNWTVLSSASGSWSTTGNGGLVAGTNFLGTTDAIDLVFKTNATEAMRVKSSGSVWFGTPTSTAGTGFFIKNKGDTLDGGLVLEGSGADTNRKWDFYVDGSNSNFSIYNPNQGQVAFSSTPTGMVSIGNQSSRYKLDVMSTDTSTDPTSIVSTSTGPYLDIRNYSATNNNFEALVFQNQGLTAVAEVVAVNEDHTASPNGHLGFWTSNAGTMQEVITVTAQGSVAIKTGVLNMNSHRINNVTDPSAAQDAATKAYVDSQLLQLNPLQSVYAASTAGVAGTYTNAVGGVCIGDTFTTTATTAFALDGTSPPVGSRVLFKDQGSSFQDGVWTLTTQAVGGVSGAVLTRALDFDTSADINAGSIIPVINGTVNAGSSWFQTAVVTTCSSDSQTWTRFQQAASAYLLKANNLSDVAVTQTAINNISQLTTKGDLLIYSGSNSVRQAACPDGQQLQYDTTQTNGVKCVTPASSGVPTFAVSTKTTHYTIAITDQVILANGTTGGFVLTLPSAASSSGYLWRIQKIDSTNSTISIVPTGNDLIKNGAPLSGEKILVLSDPGVEINILSNGSSFYAF